MNRTGIDTTMEHLDADSKNRAPFVAVRRFRLRNVEFSETLDRMRLNPEVQKRL